MPNVPGYTVAGALAVLATMHAKERVIKPLLEGALGLEVRIPQKFDSDRFGTFSREIARMGSQLDAARAKIAAAFESVPDARIGLASEGSFGPHPQVPFAPFGREIVVMRDRDSGLELVGHQAGMATHFRHETVRDGHTALAFAAQVGFPGHGLIVIGVSQDGSPWPDRLLRKDIGTPDELLAAVNEGIARCGAVHLETDMRAHRNPTRMRAIRRATVDLVRGYRSRCPHCDRPGFVITERVFGLPCSWCGAPTHALQAEVMTCAGCGHSVKRHVEAASADPGYCAGCNP